MKMSQKSSFTFLTPAGSNLIIFSKEAGSCLIIYSFIYSFILCFYLVGEVTLILIWTSWIIEEEEVCKWTHKVWYFFLDAESLLLWACQGLFYEIMSDFLLSGFCNVDTGQRWGFISQTALNRNSLVLTCGFPYNTV